MCSAQCIEIIPAILNKKSKLLQQFVQQPHWFTVQPKYAKYGRVSTNF